MRNIFLTISFLFVAFIASAQIKVLPVSEASSKNVKGPFLVYSLPTTTLKVTVTEVKITEIKGYYSDYAESLLGLSNIITDNRTYYKIENVGIETVTAPDYNNSYVVFGKNLSSVENYLSKYNSATAGDDGKVYSSKTAQLPEFFRNYADISYTKQSESFVDTKIIDGVVTQVPANHTKMVSKSFEQKARQAADAIMKCRNDQYSLAAGEQETPYTGDAITSMIAELKKWENNYMSLFTGVTLRDTMTHVYYITPSEKSEGVELFRFNENKGLSESQTQGDVYSLSFKPLKLAGNSSAILNAVGEIKSLTDKSLEIKFKKPVPVGIELLVKGRKSFDFGCLEMYQFSDIQSIPFAEKPVGTGSFGFLY